MVAGSLARLAGRARRLGVAGPLGAGGGTRHFVNTGSMLIRKQLEACQDELPFQATIIRKDNWLSLS